LREEVPVSEVEQIAAGKAGVGGAFDNQLRGAAIESSGKKIAASRCYPLPREQKVLAIGQE